MSFYKSFIGLLLLIALPVMAASDVIYPTPVARYPAQSVLSTITLMNSGTTFAVNKNRPVSTVNTYIQTWGHSGGQVGGLTTQGNLNLSGSVTANGVVLGSSAAAALTGTGAGTATAGELSVFNSKYTQSGAPLTNFNFATKQLSIGTTATRSRLYVSGSGAFTGSLSGASLRIMSGATILNGRVGIGTNGPITPLELNFAGASVIRSFDSTNNIDVRFGDDGSSAFIGVVSNIFFKINTNNNERFRILAGGGLLLTNGTTTNVGIASVNVASQTADNFQVQNSSNTVQMGIGPTGRAYFNTTSNVKGSTIYAVGSGSFTGSLSGATITANRAQNGNALVVNGSGSISGLLTNAGIGTETSSQNAVCVTSNGVFQQNNTTTCLVSSIRFKKDVATMKDIGLQAVNALRPVTYKDKDTGVSEMGLIAEEVQKVAPECVFYDKDGKTVRGVKYENCIVALLIKAQQEEAAKVRTLTDGVKSLQAAVKRLSTSSTH